MIQPSGSNGTQTVNTLNHGSFDTAVMANNNVSSAKVITININEESSGFGMDVSEIATYD